MIKRLLPLLLLVVVAACGDDASTTTTTTTEPSAGSVIAELRTPDGETYRVRLEGAAADHARQAYATGQRPGIPNGRIQPGDGGVNTGRDWHIVEVEWAEMAIEVCDGTVSYIDSLGYEGYVAQHGDRYCPWDAELVDLIEE